MASGQQHNGKTGRITTEKSPERKLFCSYDTVLKINVGVPPPGNTSDKLKEMLKCASMLNVL